MLYSPPPLHEMRTTCVGMPCSHFLGSGVIGGTIVIDHLVMGLSPLFHLLARITLYLRGSETIVL